MKDKEILIKHLSPELTINEIKAELRKRREGKKPSYNFFEAKKRAPLKSRPQGQAKQMESKKPKK